MQVKVGNYIIFIVCVLTACGLFMIKNQVINLSAQLSQVNSQIREERNKIYLLKAEVAYLTSPAILKQYAATNTELQPIKVSQIMNDPLMEQNDIVKITTAKNELIPTKWRFKKAINSKYIQQAAMRK